MTTVTKRMFCGICEASCGLEATVEHGEVTKLRPDPNHPNSRGFACSKGIAFPAICSDPDRVLEPLKRQPDGTFAPVSWDEALDDIGRRLNEVIARHGRDSIGAYIGNPNAWNFASFMWTLGLCGALKTKHLYGAFSVDINNYWVVGELLYGHNFANPVPDLDRTDFFLCVGANPLVSHGSMMNVGRIRETLLAIPERGGRVVVVDPRRSETAQLFEHVAIRPAADAWLVAALLKVVFDEGLQDQQALEQTTTGHQALGPLVAGVDLDRAARETGIAVDAIVRLARDFATAPSAVAYGRCGASLGPHSTLVKYLLDTLNIATGNLDRPGGWCFSHPMIDLERMTALLKLNGYGRWHSRVDGLPEVFGSTPLLSMPREIRTPGKGQLRALIVASGNPVTCGPASDDLENALGELDLLVSLDPYITDTSRLAHYVLPPALWMEREGLPIFTQSHSAVPYAQWCEPTVAPPESVREDWWIIDQISRRIGVMPSNAPGAQILGRLGIRPTPSTAVDALLRLGPNGDLFGLRRRGLSRRKLIDGGAPVKLADGLPVGVLRKHVRHRDRRVHLDHQVIAKEMQRLLRSPDDRGSEYPLRLFSVRELRSQNSWMHNVPKLMAGDRVQRARLHPDDALEYGVEDGTIIEVTSPYGSITTEVRVTDEVMRGSLGLPQGWGHRGGWQRAVAAGGANYNRLTSNRASDGDHASGQAHLNGVPVRVRPAPSAFA